VKTAANVINIVDNSRMPMINSFLKYNLNISIRANGEV
jgi:hypothetical protein